MTHRTEQILVAVKDTLMGLNTTKDRVYRDQVYDIKTVPALTIEYNGEELASTISTDLADWWMYISVNIHVKAENFSTIVNRIRSEITVALLTDYTLGLNFVIDTEEVDIDAPERSFDSEKPTVRQAMNWKILYRRNRSTPE